MGFAVGASSSRSSARSESSDRVFLEDAFAQLFGGASNAAANIATGGLTTTANRLFDSGTSFLSEFTGPNIDASRGFLEDRVAGGGSLLDENIAGLSDDLSRFFNEELLPGTRSAAIASGAFGGSRQAVAEDQAARNVGEQFRRGVTDLRTADVEARDRAALGLGQLETDATRARAGSAAAGIDSLAGQFDLASAGAFAELDPFVALAQILQRPTVLNESLSTSKSKSKSFSFGGAGGG